MPPCLVRAALALVAAVSAGTPARAQEAPQVISPLRVESDHNGVNLVSGKTAVDPPILSVPGAPRLRFDRVQNAAPYVKGKIYGTAPPGDDGRLAAYSVHTGQGTSESFHCQGFDCTSDTLSGSTFKGLTGNMYTYRQAGSGAVWRFVVKHVDAVAADQTRDILFYASSVTYPGGESIGFTYETVYDPYDYLNRAYQRPTMVSSSLGFHIALTYQSNIFGTNAWGQVAQAALYNSADPATPLRRLVYGTGGAITEYGAGDPVGRVYTCFGCAGQLGMDVEAASGSIQLPGEAAPALQVVQHPGAPVVAQVIKDGVQWNYAYANLRYNYASLSWNYDSLTVTGPNGFRNVYTMTIADNRNVVTRLTDSLNRVTDYWFDYGYRPYRIRFPELNEVSAGYDDKGNVSSKVTTPKPGGGAALTELAEYPPAPGGLPNTCSVLCYRPLWARDAMGRQTDFVHDAGGLMTEQTDPADANGVRRKTYVSYDASGRKTVVRVCGHATTCGTANEIRTEYDYWGATFLPSAERRIDAALGQTLTTTYAYDPAGRLLSADGPLPGSDDATYNRYDLYGRRTWEIGGKGANGRRSARRLFYRDSDDKPVAVEEGTLPDETSIALDLLTRTDLAYDGRRNPVRETVSAQGAVRGLVQRSFDESGRLECQAQRMNPAAFGSPPAGACALGPPGTVPDDYGPDRITRNTYDAAGQLLTVQRAYATPLQQNYASYGYSLNGRQTSVTDANGNRAELTWDGFDRQKRWIFPSKTSPGFANPADYEEYGYDIVGNRTSLRKRDGVTIGYQYDGANRLTLKTVPASASGAPGYAVHYGYDVRGLQTFARFGSASGPGVASAYDGFGRPVSSTTTMGGYGRTLSHLYDAGGRRSRLTHPPAYYPGYGTATLIYNYAYDAAGRPTAVTYASGAALAGWTYDPKGRPEWQTRYGTAVTGYGYDPASRLASLSHDLAGTSADQALTFAYNPASQIVTRTRSNDAYASNSAYDVSRAYSVNGLNQYTQALTGGAPSATFAYDPNGNLISDGATNFVYDAENRLVSASGAKTASLAYDPLGRLFQTSGGSAGTTQFLYDGDALIAEYDGADARLRAYVNGPGMDTPLVWFEGTLAGRSLYADHQGSIVAMATPNGSYLAINAYDAWGIPNATNVGRFAYTGQAWIPELGMYHYKARIYSPTLGRFLQTDPVGYKDQMNLYAYVGNDPVNHTDPDGQSCVMNQGVRSATCKVDNPNGLKGKALDRANRIYTRAVNRMLYNPNRRVTISARNENSNRLIRSTTTAGAVAEALIVAEVSYGGNSPSYSGVGAANAATSGSVDSPVGVRITLYKQGLAQSEHGAGRTIVHEGIHGTREGSALAAASRRFEPITICCTFDRTPPFNRSHQVSHKGAAAELYDEYNQ